MKKTMHDELDIIRYVFDNYHIIAVYGMSKQSGKSANNIPKYLKTKGFEIIPINPNHRKIIGLKSYPNLIDIEKPLEIVEVFRPSEEAMKITKEVILRKKIRNDVKVLWLQKGIKNETAKKLAQQHDILFIQDKCMYEMHRKLYGDKL
jgi:predicted CoA-binding protein